MLIIGILVAYTRTWIMKNKLTNTESFLINGIRVLIDYDDYDITFAKGTTTKQIEDTIAYLQNEGFIVPVQTWHGGGCTRHAKKVIHNPWQRPILWYIIVWKLR